MDFQEVLHFPESWASYKKGKVRLLRLILRRLTLHYHCSI